MPYIKLKDISEFTINNFEQKIYKRWDTNLKKMDTSEVWSQGYNLVYTFNTDKGLLDLSHGQLGQILALCYNPTTGEARITGKQISVKTNGKQGIEIRYFFNLPNREEEKTIPKTNEQVRFSQEQFKQAYEAGKASAQMDSLASEFGGEVINVDEIPF